MVLREDNLVVFTNLQHCGLGLHLSQSLLVGIALLGDLDGGECVLPLGVVLLSTPLSRVLVESNWLNTGDKQGRQACGILHCYYNIFILTIIDSL